MVKHRQLRVEVPPEAVQLFFDNDLRSNSVGLSSMLSHTFMVEDIRCRSGAELTGGKLAYRPRDIPPSGS